MSIEGQIEKNDAVLDPAAWVDHHGDYLFRYAVSRLRDANSAEEVVQETFVAGLRHVEQFAGKGTQRAWLVGILKRKIVDYVRQRNRAVNLVDDDGDDPSQSLFDRSGSWRTGGKLHGDRRLDALERQEFWEAFRKCLDRLPPRQADVFALREMEGIKSEEICKELDISASNLWVLLYRARMRLSTCMKSCWDSEAQ